MLSIGKVGLSRKQQLYYEEKVAKGAEDYYAGRGEVPGRWAGSGARLLGLSGELDADQLSAMMEGKHPVSGEPLATRAGRCSIAALDLTFSAPKSVSVLFAVSDAQLSRSLVDAHEEAVDAALSYLEREACRVRRGHKGTQAERDAGDPRGWQRLRTESAGGFVAAAYRHRMSRAQDPQLHTHVVCANMSRGRDGRWTALDGRPIYEHAKAAGCVYEAHLRSAVRERLPWAEWGPVREGIAELLAVPEHVRDEFSQRRRRILERERELEAAGVAVGFAGRERIAYATREAKRDIPDRDWREHILARAAEHGLGRPELERLARLPVRPPRPGVPERRLAAELFAPSGLTANQNTFHRRDVVAAIACSHRDGAVADKVAGLAESMLQEPDVVPVTRGLDARFTTRELIAAENLIVDHAEEGRCRDAGLLDEEQVIHALHGLGLSEEQRTVVCAIVGSGNRIDTIEALAGTGKTTCAGALREAYEQAGYRVLGAAPTARAARELKERAAIDESRTLDGWAVKLAADPEALWFAQLGAAQAQRQPVVLIIDEAGMAHTRVAADVIDRAIAADAKVVAIGDSGQLSSVQAGGWLGALTRRLGSEELRQVMRQRDPAERRALAKVHRGEPRTYLELKRSRTELRMFAGAEPGANAERALITRWARARQRYGSDVVMICRDNARRNRLNELARSRLHELGALGHDVEIGGREWAVGDRIIARRNDRGRDLDNGTRGTVAAVDEQSGLIVSLDTGGVRQLDADFVERDVEHAYAVTGHGMQGGTVQWAGVIGHPRDFSRNWSYTALSRAREPVEIFVVDEPSALEEVRADVAPAEAQDHDTGPLERMAGRMRQRDDEDLALEQLEHATLPDPGRLERTSGDQALKVAPRQRTTIESWVSPTRARVYELQEQVEKLRAELCSRAIEDANTILRLTDTIGDIARESDRDAKPRGRSDRRGHQVRERQRDQQLTELRAETTQLLDRTPDPAAILERATQLQEQLRVVASEHHATRDQAIREELAQVPPWLTATLGPEPGEGDRRDRWQRTARELAGHRIDHHVTSVDTGLAGSPRDAALERAIAEIGNAPERQAQDQEAAFALER
jgi:conjugative relaxase-like TrwC/TraI family protein